MTSAELPPLGERILIQMRTYPPGQARTASKIAEQMVGVSAPEALAALRILHRHCKVVMVVGDRNRKQTDAWRLA
jgi:hypothetical protein